MPIKLKRIVFLITCLLLTSCNVAAQTDGSPTITTPVITATLPATLTPRPTETLPPPPPQPTTVPVEGSTSTPLNVRAEPSTASDVIGIIAANSKVYIVGKDIGESWWQIIYEAGDEGKGWVTAQYVETAGKPEVPMIGGDGVNPQLGNTAVVIQQLKIRSGPGTAFDSLGILNANDVVTLTGRNSLGTWLQIDFAAGPEGRGWVNAGFIKADDTTSLPILSDAGDVIGTGTPANTPLPPTPTVAPAAMDFDSVDAPIKTVILGGAGTHTVLYNGSVSFPEGDTEDWISVTPQVDVLFAGIKCAGSDQVQIEIIGINTALVCNGNIQAIPVSVNVPFLIHIQATGPANQLQYTNYMLEIEGSP